MSTPVFTFHRKTLLPYRKVNIVTTIVFVVNISSINVSEIFNTIGRFIQNTVLYNYALFDYSFLRKFADNQSHSCIS